MTPLEWVATIFLGTLLLIVVWVIFLYLITLPKRIGEIKKFDQEWDRRRRELEIRREGLEIRQRRISGKVRGK